ncbi:tRNA lysidine(34) synthetase TilS [Chloroflexota bacterium]
MHQEQLEHRVLRFIQEHRLISSQQKLVVAVSGGPDSICLLNILIKLQKELHINLHLAHLNHQLRGDESEEDAQYVAQLAHRLDIPDTIDQRDVRAYKSERHLTLEEAAREVRYTFLAQVAESVGAERVAVGHTTDDHIETILMHLIRGTGTKGLRGLQPCSQRQISGSDITVIRPLLQVSRKETANYCQHHNIVPRIDSSNLSLSPLRNRIRHELMPVLQSYNPQITETLLRTARIAADDTAFLDEEATRLWNEIAQEQENSVALDKERFLRLPPALKRQLLRTTVEKLLGNLMDIETRHIEAIMAALTKQAGKKLNLPGGLIFSTEYDKYLISPNPAALSPFPALRGESPLKIPGETLLPGWHIDATVIMPEAMKIDASGYKAYLDLDKTGDNLTLRSRKPGDRFQPLGMSQPKKLNEFMIDAKIPGAWRKRIPLVCSHSHILWVVGWRIEDRAKVTDTTQKVLRLEFNRQ